MIPLSQSCSHVVEAAWIFTAKLRVATHLENLEKSGKMEKVRETEICFRL